MLVLKLRQRGKESALELRGAQVLLSWCIGRTLQEVLPKHQLGNTTLAQGLEVASLIKGSKWLGCKTELVFHGVRVHLAPRGEMIDASASRDNWDGTMEMGGEGLFNPGRRGQERRNKGIKAYSERRKHLARCRSRQNTGPSSKRPQVSSSWPWQRWEEKVGEITHMITLIWITVTLQFFDIYGLAIYTPCWQSLGLAIAVSECQNMHLLPPLSGQRKNKE